MQISQTTPPPTNLNLNSTSANLNPNFDPSNPNPNLHPRRSRKQDNLKIARAVIYRYDSLLRRIQLDNELVDWSNAAGPTTAQGIDRMYRASAYCLQKLYKATVDKQTPHLDLYQTLLDDHYYKNVDIRNFTPEFGATTCPKWRVIPPQRRNVVWPTGASSSRARTRGGEASSCVRAVLRPP